MFQRLIGTVLLGVVAASSAASAAPDPVRARIEIKLERKTGASWTAIDPSLVLNSGDVVRFRFKSNFDGYLYVTNLGTSGQYSLLFPREETGTRNVVQSGKEYVVPSTDAILRVSGPAGYESVYWLVSPVSLGHMPEMRPTRPSGSPPPVLIPRCDDTMLRARGLCLDPKAGPRVVGKEEPLPAELGKLKATTRELTIVQEQNQYVLSPAHGTASAPVLYEFRLAHK
jgi:hypothetical protein